MKRIKLFCLGLLALPFVASAAEDASIYVTALKEEGIDEKILQSQIFEDCRKAAAQSQDLTTDEGKEAIRACLSKKLEGVNDKELAEFSSNLELGSLGFKATKNSQSLREYLNKRIYNAIHGKDAWEKKNIRETKFVDHGLFLELYNSQLSKNLILEVSRYCLENVGIKGEPGAFISGLSPFGGAAGAPDGPGREEVFKSILFKQEQIPAEGLVLAWQRVAKPPAQGQGPWQLLGQGEPEQIVISSLEQIRGFWDQVEEYRYCPRVKSGANDANDPCYKTRARNQEQINILKNKELEWAEANPGKIQSKYTTCSNFMIKNMCELYRCNNVYTAESQSILYGEPATSVCPAFGANLEERKSGDISLDKVKDNRGQIACNLMTRIENYRRTFAAIEDVKNRNAELKGLATGLEIDTTFADIYDHKNVNDITSISSAELVNEVDSFNEGKETAQSLREQCFDEEGNFNFNDKDCADLGGQVDGNDLAKVQLDAEAETAMYLERLKQLERDNDKEELKEYLIKHGLHDYIQMMDEGNIPTATLVRLISDKYKADRTALINNMNERFYSLTRKKKEGGKDDAQSTVGDLAEVAKDQVSEMEQHRDRLETLYNYSNIVSSYLVAKDQDGKEVENSRARFIEKQGMGEFNSEELANYEMYFSDAKDDSGAKDNISAQGQFIDSILGIGEK